LPIFPNPAAGSVLTADDLRKFACVSAHKSGDETDNASATFQDDDHLSTAVVANGIYIIQMHFVYNANTTANFKWQFTTPAGSSFSGLTQIWNAGGLAWIAGLVDGVTGMNGTAALDVPVLVNGTLYVGGTAGTLQFRWAQNTSNASNTVVRKGSYLNVIRLA
jgi:hypothetical protein